MSSVVLANQRVPATGASTKKGLHPLVQNQQELVPNITHVFTQDQHLYLQYEVYDAAHQRKGGTVAASSGNGALDALLGTDTGSGASGGANAAPQPKPAKDAVHVLTNIEFLQGNAKVYESKQIVANELTAPDRKAVIFQIDLPLQSLKPGFYTCQVNIVDDNAGNFAFPRWPILVKESQPPATTTPSASPASAPSPAPSQPAPTAISTPSGH
jgi:hypothetical protein